MPDSSARSKSRGKRIVIALVVLVALALGLLWQLTGISPAALPSATALATGLGAKLTCSGLHLSGFDLQRLEDDIAVYSSLTRNLVYDTRPDGSVSASLFGSAPAVARYRPGLGCTLEYAQDSPLDTLVVAPLRHVGPAPWPAGAGGQPGDPAMQALLEDMVAADNAQGFDTRALLVVRDGRILGEAYAPGIGRDTPLLGWSMGKSLTAIMLGRLEMMGKVNVAEKNLFPAWAADERSAISLQNMLQMSSGLKFLEDYVPGSDSVRMLFMSPSASAVAMQSLLAHVPGTHFYYSSGTTNLLSRLVYERAGGSSQALVDFFEEEIAAPLGLERTVMELDASGVQVGSSYVYGIARDWARFGHLMVNGGVINGQQVVAEEWIVRATAANDSDNDPRYGYQFWLNDGGAQLRWPSLPRSAYSMQGNRKQFVMLLPEQRVVIVRLGWSPGDYPADYNFSRIVGKL